MGHRKSVIDVDVAELGQRRGEGRVVRLLARVKAQILEQGHLAGAEAGHHRLRRFADAVLGEGDRPAERIGQRAGNRRERHLGDPLAFRPPEMRDHDDPRAPVDERVQRRQQALDPRRIPDAAVAERHVEIAADQHPETRDIDIVERFEH